MEQLQGGYKARVNVTTHRLILDTGCSAVKQLQLYAECIKAEIEEGEKSGSGCWEMKSSLIRTLMQNCIRARLRNLAGNEIAPAGMQWGCPANWTVGTILETQGWIQLGNSSDHGFTKLDKNQAPAHIDGYKVLETKQVPTHILINGECLSRVSGGATQLGEGEITDDGIIWLQTVISPDAEPIRVRCGSSPATLSPPSTPPTYASTTL